MKVIRDLVKGIVHLLAYIPRGIAAIPMELRQRRALRREIRRWADEANRRALETWNAMTPEEQEQERRQP